MRRSAPASKPSIAAQLDDPAPALDLLNRYLGYRAEARALFAEENAAALPLERRLQRIRELRRAHFGDLAEALFAEEEERWRADIERLQVMHDPALADEERAARLAALDAELPESVREARDAATAASSLRRDEARLRAEGASDAEIGALREARFGREAAERLAALDQARAAWHERVSAYRAERDRVAALEPDDAVARAAAIAALREAHFHGAERLRIEALDRLEAQTAASANAGAANPDELGIGATGCRESKIACVRSGCRCRRRSNSRPGSSSRFNSSASSAAAR